MVAGWVAEPAGKVAGHIVVEWSDNVLDAYFVTFVGTADGLEVEEEREYLLR